MPLSSFSAALAAGAWLILAPAAGASAQECGPPKGALASAQRPVLPQRIDVVMPSVGGSRPVTCAVQVWTNEPPPADPVRAEIRPAEASSWLSATRKGVAEYGGGFISVYVLSIHPDAGRSGVEAQVLLPSSSRSSLAVPVRVVRGEAAQPGTGETAGEPNWSAVARDYQDRSARQDVAYAETVISPWAPPDLLLAGEFHYLGAQQARPRSGPAGPPPPPPYGSVPDPSSGWMSAPGAGGTPGVGPPNSPGAAPFPDPGSTSPSGDPLWDEINALMQPFLAEMNQLISRAQGSSTDSLSYDLTRLSQAWCPRFTAKAAEIRGKRTTPSPDCGPMLNLGGPSDASQVQNLASLTGQIGNVDPECFVRLMATTVCSMSAREMEVRSEQKTGFGSGWSPWYTVCSPPLPPGSQILGASFHLEGDPTRSCNAWAECQQVSLNEARACWKFRAQGHSEASAFSGGAQTTVIGVLTFKVRGQQ